MRCLHTPAGIQAPGACDGHWLSSRASVHAIAPGAALPQPRSRERASDSLYEPVIEGHELDAHWERERFAVELDGYEHHRTRAAFESDRLRQEELKLAGIEMIRITDRRLAQEPERVMKRLATLLERRRRD